MFKFRNYPIYVIYSKNWQRKVEPFQKTYKSELKFQQELLAKRFFFRNNGNTPILKTFANINQQERLLAPTFTWDIEEDIPSIYKSEILNYEFQVKQALDKIFHTKIGQIVLNSLNKASKIYIIPLFDYNLKFTAITTGPWDDIEGGGIRIAYNPEEFTQTRSGETIVDSRSSVLLHELVHASRKSNNRDYRIPLPGGSFPNIQEFLAAQIENIYIATRKESSFYSLYDSGDVSLDTAYRVLAHNRQLVLALKNLLQTEPLAQQAAALKTPEYNSFRDFSQIEADSKKYFIDL